MDMWTHYLHVIILINSEMYIPLASIKENTGCYKKGTYLRFGGLPIIVMEKRKPSVVISISQEKPDDVQIFI